MNLRKRNNGQPIYPPHEWAIVEEQFQPAYNLRNEAVFTLGNGYLGLRGNFEEGYAGPAGNSVEGTYINGFYETVELKYPEIAYGYPEQSQTMLNVTNGKVIKLYLEDEEFHMFTGTLLAYERRLDLKNGVLHRNVVWRSPAGREVKLAITRLVSFTNKHVAAIAYEVTPLNFNGKIRLFSALDGEVQNQQAGTDPRVGSHLTGQTLMVLAQSVDDRGGILLQRTKKSGFYVACAMRNRVEGPLTQVETERKPFKIGVHYAFAGEAGQTVRLEKYLAYVTAKDGAAGLGEKAASLVRWAEATGFARLCHDQQAYLAAFWAQADIVVKGDPLIQQGLRFNAFHLLQAAGQDGVTSVGAKGLTGEGYEGHYFWDTEIYILPFFINNYPAVSKALLTYRYHTLDQARQRALAIGLTRGALYPWRTIGGEECSAFFPAGTAQYHINADIAYAIKKYVAMTGDRAFLFTYGAEILFETARLCARIGLTAAEIALWQKAAERMYIPYDPDLKIYAQDDTFLAKPVWDLEATPPEKFPLLLHYHPLLIYRAQVCKQPDVVLALFLLSEQFTTAEKKRNYDYYERITTHDSSLSPSIFSIVAAEIGYHAQAYSYFTATARLDLDDYNGNTKDGLHLACMAGSWLCVVYGFAGMRVNNGVLSFAPSLPEPWQEYRFNVAYQGRIIRVVVNAEKTTYELLEGEPLTIYAHHEKIVLMTKVENARRRRSKRGEGRSDL